MNIGKQGKLFRKRIAVRIIFCLNHFFPDQIGGTEIYTLELAKALKAKGHQVLIVIPNYGKDKNDTYKFEDVDVEKYAEPQEVDRLFLQSNIPPQGLPAFCGLLERFVPDLVHFQEVTASRGISVFHLLDAKARGYKTIITFHLAGHSCHTGNLMYVDKKSCDGMINISKCAWCTYNDKGLSYTKKALLFGTSNLFFRVGYDTRKWQHKAGTALAFHFIIENLKKSFDQLTNACDHIVSITTWYKEMLIKNGVNPSKITHIPQGLRKQAACKNPKKTVDRLKLVFVGRISKIKGIHLLIEALEALPEEKISLAIYGQHNGDEYYNDCIRKSARMNNITWCGVLQPEAVVQTICLYDALCLPSICSEMSPLVIQEAFAAGLPVIASNVYGNAEQIKHGVTGWLFKLGDPEALSSCLKELITQPSKVLEARENLPAARPFALVAEEYDKLYQEIIDSA
ncbi:MAG: glycosyltransferase [Flavobacterium sp.]|nr:MAG: glycosyltransferase [Flavobacterium sp.]